MNENGNGNQGKKKPPISIIILVVLVLTGGTYLAYTNGIFGPKPADKAVSGDETPGTKKPGTGKAAAVDKDFLNVAIGNTVNHIEERTATLPDIGKFKGVPFEQSLTIGLDSVNMEALGFMGSAIEPFIGSSINLNSQLDTKAKMFSLGGSVLSPMANFKDYNMFISKDMLALKLPDLYNKKEYISVNPKTFIDDYNNSELSQGYSIDESDVDLPKVIDTAFGVLEMSSASAFDFDKYQKDSNDLLTKQLENMAFKDNGKKDGNQSVTYTLSPENAKQYITDQLELATQFYIDSFDNIAASSNGLIPYYAINDLKDQMAESNQIMIDSINFPEAIVLDCTLNSQQVITKVKSNTFKIVMQSEYDDEPAEINVSFDISFDGKDNISDDVSINIIMEAEGETVTISGNEVIKNDKDGIGRTISYNLSQGEYNSLALTFDYLWNGKEKTKNNFNAKLEVSVSDEYSGEQSFGVGITGKLIEEAKEISFTDGSIDIYQGSDSLVKLTLDYYIKQINAVSAPTSANSISIFDISATDIVEIGDKANALMGNY